MTNPDAPATATFNAKALAAATDTIKRNTPSKPLNPIYHGVLINIQPQAAGADSTTATFSVYDTEVHDHEEVDCVYTGTGPLNVLVSAALLANIAKTLRGEVSMQAGDTAVHLRSGRTHLTLPYMDAASYPELPKLPTPVGTLSTTDFDTALRATTTATGSDEANPQLSAVKVRHTADGTLLTATDRYRATRSLVPYKTVVEGVQADTDVEVMVPATFLKTNSKIGGGEGSEVELLYTPSGSLFGMRGARSHLTSATVDAQQPNIDALFAAAYSGVTFAVTISSAAVLDALARCSVVASPTSAVRLEVTPDPEATGATVSLYRRAEATGEVIEDGAYAPTLRTVGGDGTVPSDDGSGTFAIAFNAEYLGAALRACQLWDDTVCIAFTTTKSPAVVMPGTGTEGEGGQVVARNVVHEHLVMPVRLTP